jgi:hypothetical protein
VDRGDVLGFVAANAPEAVTRMTAELACGFGSQSSSCCEKSLAQFSIRNFDLASEVDAYAMLIIPTIARDNSFTRHHVFMRSNILL